ncbi:hypothetical protein ACFFRR_004436 [Megaselia abdita]
MKVLTLFCLWIYSAEAITGGIPVEITDHPYQVAILANGELIGSGVIISKDKVLVDTTASKMLFLQVAFSGYDVQLEVRAGSSDYADGGQVRFVEGIDPHPDYYITDNDVAVMTLTEPFEFSDSVTRIKLAEKVPAMGTNCSISGWGETEARCAPSWKDPEYSKTMQSAKLELVDDDMCEDSFNSTKVDKDKKVCVGSQEEVSDACQGDFGAPLVCEGELVGLASSGAFCEGTSFNRNFNNIPMMRDWIIKAGNIIYEDEIDEAAILPFPLPITRGFLFPNVGRRINVWL